MKASKRSNDIVASPIRGLTKNADAAIARGLTVYKLNIGQPDLQAPKEKLDALKDVDPKHLAYSPTRGFPFFIDAVYDYYRHHDLPVEKNEIFGTTGGSEGILFAVMLAVDPGDEILLPEPFYSNYLGFTGMAGAKVIPITTKIEEKYHLPPREKIETLITSRTKAILFTDPGNPTGTIYTEAEVEMLVDIAIKHDLWLIADEAYREFCYDGHRHTSALEFEKGWDRTIVIDSFSKRFSLCGARIGALISKNPKVRDIFDKMAVNRLSPPSLGQIVAARAIGSLDDYFAGIQREYKQRRDLATRIFESIPGALASKPDGAFFFMLRLPVADSYDFSRWLLDEFSIEGATTSLTPAKGFYETPGLGLDEVRIAYVLPVRELELALTIVKEGVREYKWAKREVQIDPCVTQRRIRTRK
ncbi:MAG: pyridoxal phosphate-dependent aminotransferase [Planctomycetes bacterium]|nr:pyridoxal phosphate-dependent aminotransferase [Planctomycetota bacterium]